MFSKNHDSRTFTTLKCYPIHFYRLILKKNELAQNLPVSIKKNIKKSETRPEKCKKNRFNNSNNNNNKKNRSIDSNPFTDNNG
jgi:hypothetical protein